MGANTTTVPVAINNYYDRRLLERALPLLLHNKFGQVRDLPKNAGEVIKFRKYGSLTAATTPLTEGITPDGSSLSVTDIIATPAQYGDYVTLTDKLLFTTLDPVLMETSDILGEQAGLTLDTITRNILHAGTSVQYCDNSSPKVNAARTDITSSDVLDSTEILVAIKTLKNAKAKKVTSMVSANNGYLTTPVNAAYIAIVHPNITNRLLSDTTNFFPVEKYADKTNLLPGEVGKMYDVRFIETTEAKVFEDAGSGSIDVYSTLILGQNAYGITRISGEAMHNIIKPLGSAGTADPLNQRATSGWKAAFTAVILQQAWMLRLEHAI